MLLKIKIGLGLMIVFLITLPELSAQTVEEIMQKFPNEHAVLLNYHRDTRIFLKNNAPVAETKEHAEIMVLDDRANGVYNKYRVFHSSFNELKALEAYTKVPDGSKHRTIKVTDIKTQSARSSGVFYDDTKESVFDFPSMVKGAVAHVSHTEYHKDPHLLIPYYFTSYMPIVNARFTVTFPSGMELKYIIKNDANKKIHFAEEKKGKQTVYEFTSHDLKSKDRYADAPPRPYYEPHVIVHLASYKKENGEDVGFFRNVDDLYKWNSSFLNNINVQPSSQLKTLVDSITVGLTSQKAKSKELYKWVQDHIKYVAFEDGLEGFIPRQAVDVYNKKYGDCKDMASLITAMHRLAGIKAYFTWIGTRDIPYTYTEVPLPITDNHMICTVNLDGQWLFLDGTDPNCIFGKPSKGIQGKQALVAISETEFKVLNVPEVEAENNVITDSTFISITEKGIKGKTSVYYNGYFAVDAYNSLQYYDSKDTKDYVKSRISKGSNKYILYDYFIDKVNSGEKVIGLKTDFEVLDYGKKVGDEFYINLNLNKLYNTSTIDTARRKIAVDNGFKFFVRNYTILEIPQGYEVSYMPESNNYKNDLFAYDIKYSVTGNKVIAVHEFKSNCIMLQPDQFNNWNETIKGLTTQYKKQLVLKKK